MAEGAPQSYSNHRRTDPWFHVFVFGVFAIQALLALWGLIKSPGLRAVWDVLVAAAWLVLFLKVRVYPLAAQDRVIRLEERLRLTSLLGEPWKGRIGELTTRQLIGLRFASDAEAPSLVEKALNEKLTEDQIKRQIVSWRADTERV